MRTGSLELVKAFQIGLVRSAELTKFPKLWD